MSILFLNMLIDIYIYIYINICTVNKYILDIYIYLIYGK